MLTETSTSSSTTRLKLKVGWEEYKRETFFFTTEKMGECETINHVGGAAAAKKRKKVVSHRSPRARTKLWRESFSLISGDKLKSFSLLFLLCGCSCEREPETVMCALLYNETLFLTLIHVSSFILRHASKNDTIWPRLTFAINDSHSLSSCQAKPFQCIQLSLVEWMQTKTRKDTKDLFHVCETARNNANFMCVWCGEIFEFRKCDSKLDRSLVIVQREWATTDRAVIVAI